MTDLDALVARLNRRLPDRSRRPFKSNATVPLNPDGPEAASAIERLKQENEELRAKEAKREELARQAWEYYLEATCACTAAERYVPTCPKHGISSEKAGSQ